MKDFEYPGFYFSVCKPSKDTHYFVWVAWRDSIMSEGRVCQYDSSVIDAAV